MIRIHGEFWVAKSENEDLEPGTKIIVVNQDRLKLLVRRTEDSERKTLG